MRDGATIVADHNARWLSRKYLLSVDGHALRSVDGRLRWLRAPTFSGLVDGGWIATTDDLHATHVTYRITEAGRAAIA